MGASAECVGVGGTNSGADPIWSVGVRAGGVTVRNIQNKASSGRRRWVSQIRLKWALGVGL